MRGQWVPVLIEKVCTTLSVCDNEKDSMKGTAVSELGFRGFLFIMGGSAERRAVDAYGDAVVVKSIQEGVDEVFSLEEVVPVGIIKIACYDCRFFPIALTHEFKEGVDLFGL